MANILDYLREVTESFSEKPFCEVDSLILSQLSYLNFAGLVPGPEKGGFVPLGDLAGEAAITSLTKHDRVPELDGELVRRAVGNPRFQDLKVGGYVNIIDREAEEQFSAVTFLLKDFAYAAYRGTDASYVAWKEDFNLAFLSPVPSQLAGAAYLNWAAETLACPLRAGAIPRAEILPFTPRCFVRRKPVNALRIFTAMTAPVFLRGFCKARNLSK